VAKRCVLEEKLLALDSLYEVVHETPIDTKMNGLDLCIEVVRSRQPLRHIRHWISRKPLEIEAWFQRTTNMKWPMGDQMVTWPMTSRKYSSIWPRKALYNKQCKQCCSWLYQLFSVCHVSLVADHFDSRPVRLTRTPGPDVRFWTYCKTCKTIFGAPASRLLQSSQLPTKVGVVRQCRRNFNFNFNFY